MDAAWIFIVIAGVVVLVALMVYVLPPLRSPEAQAADGEPGAVPSSSGSLTRGFGYLQLSSGATSRRGGVQTRLLRAYQRVDAVDPHANTRRIGEALLQAGLADVPASSREPGPPPARWPQPPADQPRDRL